MKTAISLLMIAIPIVLAACSLSGCAVRPPLETSTTALIVSYGQQHDYQYKGPYQFQSHTTNHD